MARKNTPNIDLDSKEEQLLAKLWGEISSYEEASRAFRAEGKKIYNLYVNQSNSSYDTSHRFNVVWSIAQMMQPILFSQMPNVYVERRFKDKDDQGRRASIILERTIKSVLELQDTVGTFKLPRNDFLLPGLGQVWNRYAPTFVATPQVDEFGQPLLQEDGSPLLKDELKYESVEIEYVPWQDFGYSVCKVWGGVKSVWRHLYLTKKDVEKSLGEKEASKLTYTEEVSEKEESSQKEGSSLHKKAKITEFWDKESKKIYWLAECNKKEIIKQKDDFLGLKNFFPCPKPLLGTCKNDKLIPVSDFSILKSLIEELDIVTLRESALVDAMKASGVSSGQVASALKSLFESDDNIIEPVKEWLALKQQGGASGGAVEWLPIEAFAKVLAQLRERKEELKNDIYELYGAADVIRGVTNPYESGKAIAEKSKYAGQRINEKQRTIQEFIKETVNIVAEIISEHFEPQTIYQMAGVEMLGQEFIENFMTDIALLKDDVTRNFRIGVTLESLIEEDDEKQKAAVNEFINAMAQIFGQSQAILQVMPDLKPVMLETLKFAARRYKAGRQLEGLLETTIDQALEAEKQAAMQPPQPDPEVMLEQFKVETERMKVEGRTALDQQKAAQKAEMDQVKTQHQIQLDVAKLNIEQAKLNQQKADFELKQFQVEAKAQLEAVNAEARQREFELKEKIAASELALQTATLRLEKANLEADKEINLLKIENEAQKNKADFLVQVNNQKQAEASESKQEVARTRQEVSQRGQQESSASLANAFVQAIKSMPQPVINVEAPKQKKKVGKITKNSEGSATVVVEETEDDDNE